MLYRLRIVDQFLVGEALFVQRRALGMQFDLRALADRLLLRDPRAALRGLGFEAPRFRGRTVLLGGLTAPALQLTLTRPLSSPLAQTRRRKCDGRSNKDDGSHRAHTITTITSVDTALPPCVLAAGATRGPGPSTELDGCPSKPELSGATS